MTTQRMCIKERTSTQNNKYNITELIREKLVTKFSLTHKTINKKKEGGMN